MDRSEAQPGVATGPPLATGLADALSAILGGALSADRFSLQDRASALGRPMAVIHLTWPRLRTRLALGVDPPLAHALADRLLGFERGLGELHLQITPVEWGLLGFLAAEGLDWLEAQPGPLGAWDLLIDRVGPGPFDTKDLGPVATLRWRVRLGNTTGSARLWLPETLLRPQLDQPDAALLAAHPMEDRTPESLNLDDGERPTKLVPTHLAELATDWWIEAGTATVPSSAGGPSIRVGLVLLLDDAPLGGNPTLPTGRVALTQDQGHRMPGATWQARLEPSPDGRSGQLTVSTRPEAGGNCQAARAPAPASPRTDPTTISVRIGRLRLPLGQVAHLQPGDVVAVDADAIGPVELCIQGQRVGRGELVAIDTEVGVRVVAVES